MMQGDEDDTMDEVSLLVRQPCSPSSVSVARIPKCRLLRWYQQLLGQGLGRFDQDCNPFISSISDLESLVLLHYEKLQGQFSPLLRLLNDDDEADSSTTDPEMDKIDESLFSLDPLSAMLQQDAAKLNRQKEIVQLYERDRKQHKERRGPYIPDEPQDVDATANAISYKQLISKDLLRLSSPHQKGHQEANTDVLSTNRIHHLTYTLYLFAISHPEAGYLQGMHEIASFCLYTLEIGDESFFQRRNALLTAALSYFLTESIISSLYIAYDVSTVTPVDTTNSKKASIPPYQTTPLVQMSNRILQSCSLVDTTLYSILQSSSQAIPYQLIFTKWIRLLFSREVIACATMTHADTVMVLWDALFDASYCLSQQSPLSNENVPSLQTVAEIFCISRLWHHTNTIQHLHYSSRNADSNFLLHWLMNIPPEPIAEVQKILLRMSFIISLQFNITSSLGDIEANESSLPPLNAVPPEVIAMTSSSTLRNNHGDMFPKESTSQGSHSLWDGKSNSSGSSFLHAAAAALSQKDHSKALSSLTETIASKTQSIQRLIVQEWENVQAQLIENPMYDCGIDTYKCDDLSSNRRSFPTPRKKLQEEQSIYNLDYYGSTSTISNPSEPAGHHEGKWSEQLQRNINAIHHYVVENEQQFPPQNLPNTDSQSKRLIWDALAELQSLQQELTRNGM